MIADVRSEANVAPGSNRRSSADYSARPDVYPVVELDVVLDDGSAVDDHVCPDAGSRVDDRARKDDRSGRHRCRRGHGGVSVCHRREGSARVGVDDACPGARAELADAEDEGSVPVGGVARLVVAEPRDAETSVRFFDRAYVSISDDAPLLRSRARSIEHDPGVLPTADNDQVTRHSASRSESNA